MVMLLCIYKEFVIDKLMIRRPMERMQARKRFQKQQVPSKKFSN